jgi:hypothetical protein
MCLLSTLFGRIEFDLGPALKARALPDNRFVTQALCTANASHILFVPKESDFHIGMQKLPI